MGTAAEQFIIELSRASKRGSRYWRGLSREDRDDVIATAVLWCWENRADFESSGKPLEDWFSDQLRAARKTVKPNRVPALHLYDRMAPDNVAQEAEAQDALVHLYENLTVGERQIANLLCTGYSMRGVVVALGATRTEVKRMQAKLKRLRALVPEPVFKGASPTQKAPDYDEVKEFQTHNKPAFIDHAIENMLRRPATERSDCPVCWRCCYFEGFKRPENYHPPHHADHEIEQAVEGIEQRKAEIAEE